MSAYDLYLFDTTLIIPRQNDISEATTSEGIVAGILILSSVLVAESFDELWMFRDFAIHSKRNEAVSICFVRTLQKYTQRQFRVYTTVKILQLIYNFSCLMMSPKSIAKFSHFGVVWRTYNMPTTLIAAFIVASHKNTYDFYLATYLILIH